MRHYVVTFSDVLAAHRIALTKGGGRSGLISEPLLLSAIGRPYSGYYRPIAHKAAALLHSLVKNHPFSDGNKRTAWIVTDLMIERSGYSLHTELNVQIDDLVVSVADDSLSFEQLAFWFKQHLVSVN